MVKRLPRNWVDIRRDWGGLSGYERFEAFIAFTLTLLVAMEDQPARGPAAPRAHSPSQPTR